MSFVIVSLSDCRTADKGILGGGVGDRNLHVSFFIGLLSFPACQLTSMYRPSLGSADQPISLWIIKVQSAVIRTVPAVRMRMGARKLCVGLLVGELCIFCGIPKL